MEELLIIRYLEENNEVFVFGVLENSGTLVIKIVHKDVNISRIQLTFWQGENMRRILVHEGLSLFKQAGYIEITPEDQFVFTFQIGQRFKRIILELLKELFRNSSWTLTRPLPIEIIIKPTVKTATPKKESQNYTLKSKIASPPNDVLPSSNNVKKDICDGCRSRKICFKKYEKISKTNCKDFEAGAAIIADFSQFDARY